MSEHTAEINLEALRDPVTWPLVATLQDTVLDEYDKGVLMPARDVWNDAIGWLGATPFHTVGHEDLTDTLSFPVMTWRFQDLVVAEQDGVEGVWRIDITAKGDDRALVPDCATLFRQYEGKVQSARNIRRALGGLGLRRLITQPDEAVRLHVGELFLQTADRLTARKYLQPVEKGRKPSTVEVYDDCNLHAAELRLPAAIPWFFVPEIPKEKEAECDEVKAVWRLLHSGDRELSPETLSEFAAQVEAYRTAYAPEEPLTPEIIKDCMRRMLTALHLKQADLSVFEDFRAHILQPITRWTDMRGPSVAEARRLEAARPRVVMLEQ